MYFKFVTFKTTVILSNILKKEGRAFRNIGKYVPIVYNQACYTLFSESVRMGIDFFVNFDIFKCQYLAYCWVYLHQTWGVCKAWPPRYNCVDQ